MIPLEWMPPLMFCGLVLFMLIGYPVAFSLAALGISFGFLAIYQGFFDLNFLQAIPVRVFGSVLSNELLLAIPFFTFMGAILERCGLAEDMLDSMGQLFGPIRGGLGYSVILVGFILGAITGTVAAQVIAMALISMPVMIRYGYNMRYTTGVLAASGTITQLVPPSLVLIVLADQLGKHPSEIHKWLSGEHNLTLRTIAKIEAELGVTLLEVPTFKKISDFRSCGETVTYKVTVNRPRIDRSRTSDNWKKMEQHESSKPRRFADVG